MRLLFGALLGAMALDAAGIQVMFAPARPDVGPFPNDTFTVADIQQKTGRRVNLPAGFGPASDLAILNTYDGFAPMGRIRVRFSGPVNIDTLRDGIYIVTLAAPATGENQLWPEGKFTPINEVVWDAATNTAYARADTPIDQSRRHAIVVTSNVKDRMGDPVEASAEFRACTSSPETDYCNAVSAAVMLAQASAPGSIVGAAVYTTMSATALLESARRGLEATDPGFERAPGLPVLNVSGIRGLILHRQVRTSGDKFRDDPLAIPGTLLAGAGVGRVAFGSFRTRRILAPELPVVPPVPSAVPVINAPQTEQIFFHVWLPARAMPAGGYPVILAGHGLGDDRFGMPSAIAIGLCQQGYAVVAFNAFGHGYGPEGTVRVQLADSQPQYPIGGRGIDVTGTGDIGPTDGAAIFSRQGSIFFRDSLRQTALDWSQMTRAIQRGMDLDGAGRSTLDPSRIYYFGQSLGGFYGALFLAIEPQVVSAVLNVGGDSTVRAGLLSPGQRDVLAQYLTLAGVPPDMVSLDPNIPLRYEAVRVNANPLLTAVQNQLELLRWIDAPAAPENYTPHFKGATLPGVPIKRVLYQYVVGDKTVPNPSNVGLVIAANSRETTSVFRIDRVKSRIPDAPDNPHPYLALGLLGSTQYAGLALLHQMQAGQWLSGSGETVPDVNSLARLLVGMDAFETAPPLVEALNF